MKLTTKEMKTEILTILCLKCFDILVDLPFLYITQETFCSQLKWSFLSLMINYNHGRLTGEAVSVVRAACANGVC